MRKKAAIESSAGKSERKLFFTFLSFLKRGKAGKIDSTHFFLHWIQCLLFCVTRRHKEYFYSFGNLMTFPFYQLSFKSLKRFKILHFLNYKLFEMNIQIHNFRVTPDKPNPFDEQSFAEIRLRGDQAIISIINPPIFFPLQVLFLRQINKHLALVCVIKQHNYEKQGTIDYNFQCFKNVSIC